MNLKDFSLLNHAGQVKILIGVFYIDINFLISDYSNNRGNHVKDSETNNIEN